MTLLEINLVLSFHYRHSYSLRCYRDLISDHFGDHSFITLGDQLAQAMINGLFHQGHLPNMKGQNSGRYDRLHGRCKLGIVIISSFLAVTFAVLFGLSLAGVIRFILSL